MPEELKKEVKNESKNDAIVSYYPHCNRTLEDEEWLTAERMAKWINDNDVLEIILRESLHQPQYVEKLEKILCFIIKERALLLKDLDVVLTDQAGKHEVIVKNIKNNWTIVRNKRQNLCM